MNLEKKYYKYIDYLRIVLIIAVLLFHLNILKGGYLAVSAFFVLSGYLSCISASKKEKFSIVKYYQDKVIKLYIPLIIVIFITILIVSLFSQYEWLNIKPETNSVLLCFNNYWQLNANLDYFARHTNSPFIHLWYIAILLQFDIVFPYMYLSLKKIGDKLNKVLPVVILLIPTIISVYLFCKAGLNGNIMQAYYSTTSRMFSLFIGMIFAFLTIYFEDKIIIKKENLKKIIFVIYLLLLTILFISIKSNSILFIPAMIITSLITARIINYSTYIESNNMNLLDKTCKYLSTISYEIYLIQYPLIYFITLSTLKNKITIIILTLLISGILRYSLNIKKKQNIINRLFKILLLTLIIISTSYGVYKYTKIKDYTLEMKKLEEKLAQNEQMMKEHQEAFNVQMKKEEESLLEDLANLENDEEKIKEYLNNVSITGVGDSVMLGAIEKLYQRFPNGYFDAKISRTAWVANGILQEIKRNGIMGDIVVLNLGANGDCPDTCKTEIMNTLEGKQVFWLNVTNDKDVKVNEKLSRFAEKYENLHIIDWAGVSLNHKEYFVADGIHLTSQGQDIYVETIYNEILKYYSAQIIEKKEKLLQKREETIKNKISFYGNTLLLNIYDETSKNYQQSNFIIDKNMTYELLVKEIDKAIEEDTLTNKLVFVFDEAIKMTYDQYLEIINKCYGKEIYIISTDEKVRELALNSNIIYYDFSEEYKENLLTGQNHLTNNGQKLLTEKINKYLKSE